MDIFSRNTGILESDIMLSKGAIIIGCGSVGSLVALELVADVCHGGGFGLRQFLIATGVPVRYADGLHLGISKSDDAVRVVVVLLCHGERAVHEGYSGVGYGTS